VRVTTEIIVGSVARTIESEVLPEAPAGWHASYLRSALMLLTYLEDRVNLEPGLLREDDRELRALLAEGARALGAPDADPALAARLRDAAEAPEGGAAGYETRRATLCDLIVAVYRRRRVGEGPAAVHQLADAIAEYRERSLAREDLVWRRAEVLPLM
jgi:hypothetical protein